MTEPVKPMTAWLAALPQRTPPDDLWMRILETRLARQQQRLRRRTAAAGFALAASLVLAVALWIQPQVPQSSRATGEARLAALIAQTAELEQALANQSARFAGLTPPQQQLVRNQQAQLVALDRKLSEAYQRRASDERLAELWQRRVDLMAGLIWIYDGSAPT